MRGSDTCVKGTGWSRLVKESGSSNKESDSGGSFGIGKSAMFACSDLRTVFYSSLNDEGMESNIGVTKLISFKDPVVGWTTGTGYYSANDQFVAIPKMYSFDKNYHRDLEGTDIYIMGIPNIPNLHDDIVKSVLVNFFVSIIRKQLVVNVQGIVIDYSTIGEFIDRLNPYDKNKDISALINYYHLLTSKNPKTIKIQLNADEYGKKHGFKDK